MYCLKIIQAIVHVKYKILGIVFYIILGKKVYVLLNNGKLRVSEVCCVLKLLTCISSKRQENNVTVSIYATI